MAQAVTRYAFLLGFTTLFLLSLPARGQEATFDPVVVQETETAAQYRRAVGRKADTKITYVDRYTGDLLGGTEARRRPETDFREPVVGGNFGIIVIVGILVLGILLFFYFGGGGALLSGAPGEFKRRRVSRAEWELEEDLGPDGYGALLNRLAGASDRAEALVQMLRYSLIEASETTGVLFARSDTEREALRRLPDTWIKQTDIAALLKATELAHYGGRPVDQTTFESCLRIARRILLPGGSRNG